MSRPRAERATRLAIVGAQSSLGGELRERLSEGGVPGSRVDLYGTTGGEAVLSEYAGEARLIQSPDTTELSGHDVIFLCERESAPDVAALAGPETVVIDVCGALGVRAGVPLADPGTEAGPADPRVRLWRLPHAIAAMLTEVLRPLDRALGISRVTAVLLRPAADHGEAGLDELRDQTVRLLNFAELPTGTFGRQLTFNVIPQWMLGGENGLEHRIVADLQELLGWSAGSIALDVVNVPVFYGHAVSLHVRLSGDWTMEAVREALGAERLSSEVTTPIEAAGERRTVVADLAESGDGLRLWVVAGEVGKIPAELAVRLTRRLHEA